MKKIITALAIFASTLVFSQVGIGTASPNSNSILDLTASDKALLIPRVANTNAIASPVNGMLIYDISENCFKGYANGSWSGCFGNTSPNLTPEQEFTNFNNSFNSISVSWLNPSVTSEPQIAASGRVGFGITNCFVDWVADAFDGAGWIFVNSTSLSDNPSSKLLPYTTNAASTGGAVTISSLLGGKKYFTNFSTNRKLFAFYAQSENITSLKFVSDSGIDSASLDAVTGNFLSSDGKYRCYYQCANGPSNDAFLIHMFFVKATESSFVTFEQTRQDYGSTIGNQSPALDDYAARIFWSTAGQVSRVYGLMAVKGDGASGPGSLPTNADMLLLADQFAAILP